MPKAQTKKSNVTDNRHQYILRNLDTKNAVLVNLTVPAPGTTTDFEFSWLRPPCAEDLAWYARWKGSIGKEFSRAVGRELRLRMEDTLIPAGAD